MPSRLTRSILNVSGPDARDFLNNLLTHNVARLGDRPALYCALLSPQGKVFADMLLWPGPGDSIWIEADMQRGEELLRRLTMYTLRSQAVVRDASDEMSAVWDRAPFPGATPDPRMPDTKLGYRSLASVAQAADLPNGDEVYEAVRIAVGAPDLARDCGPEEVFALEALLEEFQGVDFHKGCFVGQENVSRMKRRATTRKKLCPIRFADAAAAEAVGFGTPVMAGEADIGSVRSRMGDLAIGLIRLDRALEAQAAGQALSAGGHAVSLEPPAWLTLPERVGD